MIHPVVVVVIFVVVGLATYVLALAALNGERRGIAWKLTQAAEGQDALAEAEEREGDSAHAAIRRQNAWAFRKAAEMIRTGRW